MGGAAVYGTYQPTDGVLAQITFAAGFAGIPVSGVIMRNDDQFSNESVRFCLQIYGLGVTISEMIWGSRFMLYRIHMCKVLDGTKDRKLIPYSVFIDPPLSSETEALRKGYKVKVANMACRGDSKGTSTEANWTDS